MDWVKGTRRGRGFFLSLAFLVGVGGILFWALGPSKLPAPRWQRSLWATLSPGKSPPADRSPAQLSDPRPESFIPLDTARAALRSEAGGSLLFPADAGKLDIPPGALRQDTGIEAVLMTDADRGIMAVDLRPDGLSFDKPVLISLPLPPGSDPKSAEIVVFDPATQSWLPEVRQGIAADQGSLVAEITHFSLRRIRIHPGMDFPGNPHAVRGSFFLEADLANRFEKLAGGRWEAVQRQGPDLKELARRGRSGRHELIASGRLRAVLDGLTGSEVLRDELRTVILPAESPEVQTGWVKLTRLDPLGGLTTFSTVARVIPATPAEAAGPVPGTVKLSRAAMEALGLAWGSDFGFRGDAPEQTFIRMPGPGGEPLPFVPLRIEPWQAGEAGGPPGGAGIAR